LSKRKSKISNEPITVFRRYANFSPQFCEDLKELAKTEEKLYDRAWSIIDNTLEDPFKGIGKPEPLKHVGSNVWFRRLSQEHRIVYVIRDERIDFIQAKYHY
jgi:toxin YoeB